MLQKYNSVKAHY